jgi:cation diffusion facilitator family transporter
MDTEIPTPASGERIALIGIIANIVLTMVKFTGGILGNSYALIADAIESATDIIGSSIVYLGVRYAQKPADSNHPYGHGKTEPMAWLAVSILLIFAVIEIATGAISRIQDLDAGIPALWTLWILIAVVFIKGWLFIREYRIGKNLASTAIIWDAWHHLSDALTTSIALIGTLLALFAWPTLSSAADWAALIAAICMCYNIYHIGWPAMRELLDEVDDPVLQSEVRSTIEKNKDVKHINLCIVRKSGFDRLLDLRIIVDGSISVRDGHLIAHQVEADIKRTYPHITSVMVHTEPDYEVVE